MGTEMVLKFAKFSIVDRRHGVEFSAGTYVETTPEIAKLYPDELIEPLVPYNKKQHEKVVIGEVGDTPQKQITIRPTPEAMRMMGLTPTPPPVEIKQKIEPKEPPADLKPKVQPGMGSEDANPAPAPKAKKPAAKAAARTVRVKK